MPLQMLLPEIPRPDTLIAPVPGTAVPARFIMVGVQLRAGEEAGEVRVPDLEADLGGEGAEVGEGFGGE
jgi:hypothetical protein